MRFGILLAASLLMVTPAMALTADEAEAVVTVVEQLAAETGEGMVADAAEIFFDYDALSGNLIPAAGFDRASWVVAYDAVASGYMAVIPQDQFDAIFEEPLAMLEGSALPDDQKAMMREHVEGLIAEARATREQGAVHAEAVRPLEGRLHALFFGEFGE
ncbi:MAG: hypothetical protein ABW043_11370 [Devosia sp.]|uniref:hypothetical protein n=1 Tax=Devosia sp. TaxID=1871048 RepID=UPI0033951EE0